MVEIPEKEVNEEHRLAIKRSQVEIVCPDCRSGELDLMPLGGNVYCRKCGAAYGVKGTIIDVLPRYHVKRYFWHSIVEWDFFVDVYESWFWRTGPYGNIVFGISFNDEFKLISDVHQLKGTESLVDIACGPGIYSRPFAMQLSEGTVAGLDLSMPMLEYASKKAQSIDNLFFIHGDAQDLPFFENSLDGANCCGALHLFPDIPRTLKGVLRILKPGAHFTVATVKVPAMGTVSRKLSHLYHKYGGVRSFVPEELACLFEEAGFTDFVCHHAVRWWTIVSAKKPG
ncbi:MAG: methyltransferase domain-containing protein [Theionarchaea archaeon]|nr:methyltransferase domain-containing protein [Theionarchaea archaeon]